MSDVGTDTRFAWRRPGVWWLLSAILVPIVLAVILAASRDDHIEGALEARADDALASAGAQGVLVTAYGRDLTVNARPDVRLTTEQLQAAVDVVAEVEGVRSVDYGTDDSGSAGDGSTHLTFDLWPMLVAAYVGGSLLVWVVAAATLPSERRLEAETALETEAVL